jgi:hypothetical protein
MMRWLRFFYQWDNGCWAHTLVQYANIEKHWGKDWRRKFNDRNRHHD